MMIAVVYSQPWQKNKLVYVQYAKVRISIRYKDSSINYLVFLMPSYGFRIISDLLSSHKEEFMTV